MNRGLALPVELRSVPRCSASSRSTEARVLVAQDGLLAAIQEPTRITLVALPSGEPFGVVQTELVTDVGWIGSPSRLLTLARLETGTRVRVVDPRAARLIAEREARRVVAPARMRRRPRARMRRSDRDDSVVSRRGARRTAVPDAHGAGDRRCGRHALRGRRRLVDRRVGSGRDDAAAHVAPPGRRDRDGAGRQRARRVANDTSRAGAHLRDPARHARSAEDPRPARAHHPDRRPAAQRRARVPRRIGPRPHRRPRRHLGVANARHPTRGARRSNRARCRQRAARRRQRARPADDGRAARDTDLARAARRVDAQRHRRPRPARARDRRGSAGA